MRLRKATRSILGLALVLLVQAGCGATTKAPVEPPEPVTTPTTAAAVTPEPTTTPTPPAVVASSAQRITSPDIDNSDLWELAAGNNAFAFELYRALRSGDNDLLYSPFSISQALAMVYAGAGGQTAQQMADTLHYTLPQERLHPAFNALDLELASRSHAATQTASDEPADQVAFELHIANAVWGQQGYPFLDEYLDVLARNYGSGIRPVDFEQAVDQAIGSINRWASQETEGRIQNIVTELDPDTKLVLSNAIYFNAVWELPFDEQHTFEEPFYLLDGQQARVPMMHQRGRFRYTEGEGYQAIELPYLGRQVAMVILLPAEDRFQEIEAQLTGEWVQEVLDGFDSCEVILTMPKFGFETPTLNLKEVLLTLGMPDAFAPGADFFGIVKREPNVHIYLGDVLHKAFIEVDEERTEAAAVTVVEVIVEVSIDKEPTPTPIVMRIDRPFLFLIRDIDTKTILFVGREMNPAQ